jgi:hypothetical protein
LDQTIPRLLTALSSVAERKEAEDMRSLRSFLVAFFLVALLLVAASAAAVGAASPNQASGEITVFSDTGSVAVVDFTGSLLGRATEVYTAVVHDSVKVDVHGYGSFTGTFEGRSGTLPIDSMDTAKSKTGRWPDKSRLIAEQATCPGSKGISASRAKAATSPMMAG